MQSHSPHLPGYISPEAVDLLSPEARASVEQGPKADAPMIPVGEPTDPDEKVSEPDGANNGTSVLSGLTAPKSLGERVVDLEMRCNNLEREIASLRAGEAMATDRGDDDRSILERARFVLDKYFTGPGDRPDGA